MYMFVVYFPLTYNVIRHGGRVLQLPRVAKSRSIGARIRDLPRAGGQPRPARTSTGQRVITAGIVIRLVLCKAYCNVIFSASCV